MYVFKARAILTSTAHGPSTNMPKPGRLLDSVPTILHRRASIVIASLIASLLVLYWFAGSHDAPVLGAGPSWSPRKPANRFDGTWDYGRDRDNLLLTQGQCDQAFPALFTEITRAVNKWKHSRIDKTVIDSITPQNGFVRAMIYDQKVCFPPRGGQPLPDSVAS